MKKTIVTCDAEGCAAVRPDYRCAEYTCPGWTAVHVLSASLPSYAQTEFFACSPAHLANVYAQLAVAAIAKPVEFPCFVCGVEAPAENHVGGYDPRDYCDAHKPSIAQPAPGEAGAREAPAGVSNTPPQNASPAAR